MIEINFIEEIIVILINLIGFWLAFWVLSANKRERLNQWFTLMTLFVILWVDFAFLANKINENFLSTIFYRLNWGAVILSLISSFYFYIIHFLNEKEKYKILEKIILIFGLGLFFLSIFTNFIIKGTIIQPWGSEIIFGPGNILFYLYSFFVALIVIGLLIKKYFQFFKDQKLKIQYFLIGTLIFVSFNIIFNIFMPLTAKTVEYSYLGDYSAIFFLIFTAYAIVKQELFGIKVLFTQFLVILMGIILLIIPFLIDILWIKALLFGVFLLFIFFGYALIQYSLKEERQKEILEEKVEERVQDIENLFRRLEKREKELETFYKFTTGREVEMVELKKRIKELEKEYKKK